MIDNLLWYTTRGAGIVSLIMLTGVVCLGILTAARWQRSGWPRFLSAELHRSLALMTLVFLGIHIVVAVVDPYTSLGFAAALVPFSSPYKWFWLGLGGVGLYLLAAIIITSLLRAHLGHRTWRTVHWLTYGAWPIALIHGFGTGTDSPAIWMWAIDAACVIAVLSALSWRLLAADEVQASRDAALPTGTSQRLVR